MMAAEAWTPGDCDTPHALSDDGTDVRTLLHMGAGVWGGKGGGGRIWNLVTVAEVAIYFSFGQGRGKER